MIRYIGQLKDIKPATIKRTKKGKTIYMCTDILTFDIETSNLYRDKSGRVVGTAATSNGTTIYRDKSGRVTGTATTHGGRTTYRDKSGRVIGSNY